MRFVRFAVAILAGAIAAVASDVVRADETNVAVAANFTEPAKEIARLFESRTGHKAILSFGATGQFYVQISEAAPFQVFLSADQGTAKKLVDDGLAVGDSLFTYAVGKIVVFSKDPGLVTGEETLRDAKFNKIAVANPKTAPYGAAAVEAMKALGVYEKLSGKIVQGSNISQTFQFVDTGNAEIGFVALSQVIGIPGGSRWIVPANLYAPIRQDAVLLKIGADNAAAQDFIAFLKGPEAAAVIERFGYATK
ncbi:MAG TPA: molybdate ABC transporter substrate-binding protein [Xanthobacteraceae bacterium]|nr:molybdate ABC transporter substrate-binding protein [Xanthobacteraceae bacterium]